MNNLLFMQKNIATRLITQVDVKVLLLLHYYSNINVFNKNLVIYDSPNKHISNTVIIRRTLHSTFSSVLIIFMLYF